MLTSADIHKDTYIQVVSVISLANMPIYKLHKEGREKR